MFDFRPWQRRDNGAELHPHRSLTMIVLASALVAASCATSNAPPKPKATAAQVSPSPSKAGARWITLAPDFIATVRLDLGPRGVLYVGESGRRALVARDGRCEQSPWPLPDQVVSARVAADGVVTFLTRFFGVYAAREPLGPYHMLRSPQDAEGIGPIVLAATGRSAFVVATHDEVKRSVDGGMTWVRLDLPTTPFVPLRLRLDATGRGALSFMPRWELSTDDDGATWHDVPGGVDWAPDAPRYEVSEDGVRPLVVGPRNASKWSGNLTLIDSTVVVQAQAGLGLTALGSAPPAVTRVFDQACSRSHVDGQTNDITVACHTSRGTELVHWDGTSWQPDGTIERELDSGGKEIATAPGGWIAIYAPYLPAWVRLRRGEAFRALEPQPDIHAIAVDRRRRRVFALAVTSGKDPRELWTGTLDEARLKRVTVLAPWFDARPCNLALAKDGGVTIYVETPEPAIAHYAADGTLLAHYAPPLRRLHSVVGRRALGEGTDSALWESADGGRSWSRVLGPSNSSYRCTEQGCVAQSGFRVGWELAENTRGDVAASAGWPQHPAPQVKVVPKRPTPIAFECTPQGLTVPVAADRAPDGGDPGAFAPLSPFLAGMDRAGDTRFAYFETGRDGSVQAAFANGADRVRRRQLLGPAAPGAVTDTVFDPIGLIAVRYSRAVPREDGPVAGLANVEVAWLDARTTRVGHGRIAAVAFTALPHYRGNEGYPIANQLTAIGDSGLLLRVFGTESAWLVRPSGVVQPLAWPAAESSKESNPVPIEAVLDGDKLTLLALEQGSVQTYRSNRPGSDWSRVTWPWSESSTWGQLSILRTSNSAALLDLDGWLFQVDAGSPDPSHAPSKLTPTGADGRLDACTIQQLDGLSFVSEDQDDRFVVPVVQMAERRFSNLRVGTRVAADGRICVSALLAQHDAESVLLAPHDPEHAWFIVWDDSNFATSMRRARCRRLETTE